MSQEQQESEGFRESDDVKSNRIDAGITIAILLVAGFFLVVSQQFAGMATTAGDPGPAFWPRTILLVIVGVGFINLWLIYNRSKNSDESTTAETERSVSELGLDTFSNTTENQRQYFAAVVLSIGYIAVLQPIGFLVSTPFYLFALSWVLGYKSPVKLTAFSLGVALVMFLAFGNVFNIALPYGDGVFRQISIFFEGLL